MEDKGRRAAESPGLSRLGLVRQQLKVVHRRGTSCIAVDRLGVAAGEVKAEVGSGRNRTAEQWIGSNAAIR